MDQNVETIQSIHCERCKKALENNGFHVNIAKNKAEILDLDRKSVV